MHPTQSGVSPRLLSTIYALNFFRIGYQTVAIAWFATQKTGRTSSVAEILLIVSVATLCLSPLMGYLVDAIPRKRMLLCVAHSVIVLCGITVGVAGYFIPGVPTFSVLAFMAVALAGASLLGGGAMDYFLRETIANGLRTRRIASLNMVAQISLIAGTAAAGCAASLMTIGTAFLTLSVCSGINTILCRLHLPDLRILKTTEVLKTGFCLGNAFLYLQFPALFLIACCSALAFSVGQITNTLLPGLIAISLKLGSLSYSTIEAVWAVGALSASAYLAMKHKACAGRSHVDLFTICAMAIVLVAIPFASAVSELITIHFLLGIGFAFVRVRSESRFLNECPVHFLGRIRANSMALSSIVGLAIYCIPLVSEDASISSLYLVFGTMVFSTGVILLIASAEWRRTPAKDQ